MSLNLIGPFRFGDFLLDPQERLLERDGKVVSIAPKAFDALLILAGNAGTLVDRAQLRARLWPGIAIIEETTIARVIADVRKALGDAGEPRRYIETVPKFGYRFIATVVIATLERVPVETPAPPIVRLIVPLPANTGKANPLVWPRWVTAGLLTIILATGLASLRIGRKTPVQSLTIAPFQVIGGGSDAIDLQFGLQDSLTTELSGLPGLAVRSMTPDRRLAAVPDGVTEIGRLYHADFALMGTVQLVGGRMRVNARLLRTADGQAVWTGTFEEPSGDLFKVEASLAKRALAELLPSLSSNSAERLAGRFPANAAAHRYYQLGRHYWNQRDDTASASAVEMFQKAVEADPSYALAYTGMADAYLFLGGQPNSETIPRATAALYKAIRINPDLGEPHATLGLIAESHEFNWDKAEREFRTAIRLAPNYATAHHWYAEFLSMMGKFDQAETEFDVTRELDPLSPIIVVDLAQLYSFRRDYESALKTLDDALKLDPGFHLARERKGYVRMLMRQPQQAIEEFREADRQAGRQSWIGLDAWAAAIAGRRQEAIELTRQAEQHGPSLPLLAVIWAELGDFDRSIEWLRRSSQEHIAGIASIKVNPVFDKLRGTPAFHEILRQMKLTAD